MIPVSHTDSGPAAQARIAPRSYIEGAKLAAKRANQAVSIDFLEELDNDNGKQSRSYCYGCL